MTLFRVTMYQREPESRKVKYVWYDHNKDLRLYNKGMFMMLARPRRVVQPPNPNPTRAMPAAMPFLSIAFDLISFLLRIASLVDFCRNHW